MKDVIAAAERSRKNKGPLVMDINVNKTTIAKVAKVSSAIDLGNKYSQVIGNANIDAPGNLGLTGIKKYWRYTGQI